MEGKPRTGFFDLPREIRDVIYEYSVISMRDTRWSGHRKTMDMDWSGICQCQQDTLATIRARPPYFAHHSQSCLAPDRFLYSVSLVSKQFSTEIRPLFFRNTAFHPGANPSDHNVLREPFGGPLLEHYADFIYALGPEAKELRRLMIAVTKGRSPNDTGDVGMEEDSEFPDPSPADAERELEPLAGLLHRNISVLVGMKVYRDDMLIVSYFHCRKSEDGERAFVAEEIDDPDEWEAYAQDV